MNEKVLHLQSVNNLITAAVKFSERHGVDANDKYQRHHRHRRPTRRVEKQTKTAKNLNLEDFDRKEFIQVLDVQKQAHTDNVEAACDILAPAINLLLPPFDNDPKEEDVDSLVKMLPRSLQPDNDVLCAELTLFRNHCRENKLEFETIVEAARLAMKFESIFPLTNRCYRLILTAPITSASSERSFSKLKLIKTVMLLVMNQDRLKDFMTLGSEKD
jgi:hypothetical protein